jgi:2,4-dienoyl-CoA reductase-like NADH-dependent reductase (Old Yellow Enzyme family)
MNVTPLYQPLPVRARIVPNRIVAPPMVVARGIGTPEAIDWYGKLAAGGAGLVVVEATDMPTLVGGGPEGYPQVTLDDLRRQVDAIHAHGALAAIQIFPGIRGQATRPADLDAADIKTLVEDYCRATELCATAGFDGVQPHGAHGFLLNQFISPEQNLRTDAYGGSLENRMRLAVQIVEAIRPVCGDEMLLIYRHTPVGKGYGIDESVALGHALVTAGLDILDLSPSSVEYPGDRAAPFRSLGVPVIAVGRLDEIERALEVLNEDRADLVAVGRALIADAEWPIKVRQGRMGEIVRCIRCDGCHEDLRSGRVVGCTQWS